MIPSNSRKRTKKKEEMELRNTADTAIFTAEKMLKDSADKIEPEDKVKVEEDVAALQENY